MKRKQEKQKMESPEKEKIKLTILEELKQKLLALDSHSFVNKLDSLSLAELESLGNLSELGDLNSVDKYGMNILHMAASNGSLGTMKYIVEQKLVSKRHVTPRLP